MRISLSFARLSAVACGLLMLGLSTAWAASIEPTVAALLEAHGRADATAEGENFRARIQADLERSRQARAEGDSGAADKLLQEVYRDLIHQIRDLRQRPGAEESMRSANASVKSGRGHDLVRDFDRRLQEVEMLLEIIRRRDPGDTHAIRQQKVQEAIEITKIVDRARHWRNNDPEGALIMLDAAYVQEKEAIRRLKETAANQAVQGRDASPVGEPGKHDRDYDNLNATLEELLRAQRRILADEYPDNLPERKVADSVEHLRAEAGKLRSESRLDDARLVLNGAYNLIKQSVMRLRDGRTLVRTLTFESAEQEYQYEIQRHDMHLELAKMLLDARANQPDVLSRGEPVTRQSRTLRAQAEQAAARDDYPAAVKLLEQASDEIYKLFRIAGLPVPG